jgi:hypothetical protein
LAAVEQVITGERTADDLYDRTIRTARLSRATTNSPDGCVGPVPLGAGPTVVVDQAAERAAPAAANPR